MRKIQKRKLGSINEDQLETLEDFLNFLKTLGVLTDHHVIYRRYHDTVTTYRNGSPGLSIDSQWCSLYDVERIIIVDANSDGTT